MTSQSKNHDEQLPVGSGVGTPVLAAISTLNSEYIPLMSSTFATDVVLEGSCSTFLGYGQ